MLEGPPGEPLPALERDLAYEVRVRLARRAEDEPLGTVFEEVDEARMDGARVREQADDGLQDLLEIERRPDCRDDLVENTALAAVSQRPCDAVIVLRPVGF